MRDPPTVFRRPCVIRKLGATIEVCLDKAIFLKTQDPTIFHVCHLDPQKCLYYSSNTLEYQLISILISHVYFISNPPKGKKIE
jgi:hypothetical protein